MNRSRINHSSILNDLLGEFLAPIVAEQPFKKRSAHPPQERGQFRPAVNILEGEKGYHIELSVPGFKKDNFDIKVEKDQLIISGKKESPKKDDDDVVKLKHKRREFSFLSFQRSFHLPEDLDKDGIEANVDSGILTISIPKAEEAVEQIKNISVS